MWMPIAKGALLIFVVGGTIFYVVSIVRKQRAVGETSTPTPISPTDRLRVYNHRNGLIIGPMMATMAMTLTDLRAKRGLDTSPNAPSSRSFLMPRMSTILERISTTYRPAPRREIRREIKRCEGPDSHDRDDAELHVLAAGDPMTPTTVRDSIHHRKRDQRDRRHDNDPHFLGVNDVLKNGRSAQSYYENQKPPQLRGSDIAPIRIRWRFVRAAVVSTCSRPPGPAVLEAKRKDPSPDLDERPTEIGRNSHEDKASENQQCTRPQVRERS
ncbi:hypothetical protein BH09ACT8_BH09ACT8_42920 [soil metagenome]